MIIEKIYKTEDGRTFNTEAEALAYEKKLENENKKKAEINKELTSLKNELDKKLEDAAKAYTEYSKAYEAYVDAYTKHYGKKPFSFSEDIQGLIDMLF